MELRQLRAVEAVARRRHFTQAAEELHVAQSALSHQVQRLEGELGTPLFERTSRRVTPTEAGIAIAARARRVLAEVDAAHQEVDELRGVIRGRICVGTLPPGGQIDAPGLLARFSRLHPGVDVSVREGIAADMLRLVLADELDATFCLLREPFPEDLTVERLGEDEMVAAFAPDRAPKTAYVTVADLAAEPIIGPRRGSTITSVLDERFAAAGRELRPALESGDPFLLRSLASRGFAAAILPRSLTDLEGPPLEVRSLRPAARLSVALARRSGRQTAPAARVFVEFVRQETGALDPDGGG